MAPDFTSFLLDLLYEEWASGMGPVPRRPIIIDRRNTERRSQRDSRGSADLSENNVVGVGATPNTTNEPDGFAYNYAYEGGADVRIRGKDYDEGGHIRGVRGSDGWNELTGHVKGIINRERRHPIEKPGYDGAYTLRIDNVSDLSQRYAETYWLQFDVFFYGKETLP